MDCIGVDIGGTSINAALISFKDARPEILRRVSNPADADHGKEAFLTAIVKSIRQVISKDTGAIGIGCPGPLDHKRGVILDPPNLPLKDFNMKEFIEREIKLPVTVDNDGNCFALGESLFREDCVLVGVTLGTGFGGGIVVNREIFHGAGNAAEFWKMSNRDSINEKVLGSARFSDPKGLEESAHLGDKDAIREYHDYGNDLGNALADIVAVVDPDVILIGGSISNANRFFSRAAESVLHSRVPWFKGEMHYVGTPDTALLGAAAITLPEPMTRANISTAGKPWGKFVQYAHNRRCTVKIITVEKDQALSLQSHQHRTELWVMLDDGLEVTIGDTTTQAAKGDEFIVPKGAKHRIASTTPKARFLEVSFGDSDEKDITRYEDKYGRAEPKSSGSAPSQSK